MSAGTLKRVIYLENSTLQAMSRDTRFTTRFPWLAALAAQAPPSVSPGGCSSCAKRREENAAFMAVKRQIAGLSGTDLDELKSMLMTQQIRVRWVDGGGRSSERTL